jgi:hypothetical protein
MKIGDVYYAEVRHPRYNHFYVKYEVDRMEKNKFVIHEYWPPDLTRGLEFFVFKANSYDDFTNNIFKDGRFLVSKEEFIMGTLL